MFQTDPTERTVSASSDGKTCLDTNLIAQFLSLSFLACRPQITT